MGRRPAWNYSGRCWPTPPCSSTSRCTPPTLNCSAAPATGDPALAESLITNLVGNAIRHNVDGGWVEISTAITDGRADLTVSNTGPLISPDEVDRLFQPFQRTGIRRTGGAHGHGLGLAIVSAITGVHGAELTVAARPEGGLRITVSFP